jgi:general secretion pathway protein M
MNVSVQALLHAYARLAPRERWLLQIAAGTLVAVILWAGGSWLQGTKERLRLQIAAKERQLEEIQQLRRTYLRLKSEVERVAATSASRPENFSLFSFLDATGKKTLSREKIRKMSPSTKTAGSLVEESVEMELSGVTLSQVVDLLYEVENAPTPLVVSRLQMKKRYNDPYLFEVTLVVTSVTAA